MHITCSRQTLSRGLAVVGRAVPSRSTLPILANIHLATDQGRLRLAAIMRDYLKSCQSSEDFFRTSGFEFTTSATFLSKEDLLGAFARFWFPT